MSIICVWVHKRANKSMTAPIEADKSSRRFVRQSHMTDNNVWTSADFVSTNSEAIGVNVNAATA